MVVDVCIDVLEIVVRENENSVASTGHEGGARVFPVENDGVVDRRPIDESDAALDPKRRVEYAIGAADVRKGTLRFVVARISARDHLWALSPIVVDQYTHCRTWTSHARRIAKRATSQDPRVFSLTRRVPKGASWLLLRAMHPLKKVR